MQSMVLEEKVEQLTLQGAAIGRGLFSSAEHAAPHTEVRLEQRGDGDVIPAPSAW